MSTSSTHRGVSWYKSKNCWRACVGGWGHLGYFEDEVEAARAYDRASKERSKDPILNFLEDGSLNPDRKKWGGGPKTSKYRGVYPDPCGKWKAQFGFKGKKKYLGLYPSEEDAPRAYDAAVVKLGLDRELNFPDETEAIRGKGEAQGSSGGQGGHEARSAITTDSDDDDGDDAEETGADDDKDFDEDDDDDDDWAFDNVHGGEGLGKVAAGTLGCGGMQGIHEGGQAGQRQMQSEQKMGGTEQHNKAAAVALMQAGQLQTQSEQKMLATEQHGEAAPVALARGEGLGDEGGPLKAVIKEEEEEVVVVGVVKAEPAGAADMMANVDDGQASAKRRKTDNGGPDVLFQLRMVMFEAYNRATTAEKPKCTQALQLLLKAEALSEDERTSLRAYAACAVEGMEGRLITATQAEKQRVVSDFVEAVHGGLFGQ